MNEKKEVNNTAQQTLIKYNHNCKIHRLDATK